MQHVFKAVSYTHLDVYKRQPLSRGVYYRSSQEGLTMTDSSISSITRRQFISIAAAATAAAALPAGDFALGQSSTEAAPQAASSHVALDPGWTDAGIIATRNSPYAKLKSVPVRACLLYTSRCV